VATSFSGYWRLSRAPRYSLLFAGPLLVGYQVLAAFAPGEAHHSLRNGADVMLQTLFIWIAGPWGPIAFLCTVTGLGLWLVVRDMHAHGRRLSAAIFLAMTSEAVALALLFGLVVGGLTSRVVAAPAVIAPSPIAALGWPSRLMLSLGAGIYEELLFRVILVTALARGARALLGWNSLAAGVFGVTLGALAFSAVHYIGPFGDRPTLYSFVFRMIAGVFFSALYLVRGFGITAWTHALYDILLLLG
jgi:hypothetical protein